MLIQKLRQLAETMPDKTALQINGDNGYEKISYPELKKLVFYSASLLADSGLKPGDHIAIYAENSPGWAVSFLSVHALGAVAIPLDAQLDLENISNLIKFSDSRAVITCDANKKALKDMLTDLVSDIKIISISELTATSSQRRKFEPYKFKSDDLMSIIFTSGTTGNPKGVELTAGNIMSNIQEVISKLKITKNDNFLNILPLNHVFSCTLCLLTPIYTGAAVTFCSSLKSTDLLKTVKETGVTIFPGVPKLFSIFNNEIFNKVNNLGFFAKLMFLSLFSVSKWARKLFGIRTGKLFFRQAHNTFGGKLRFFASGGAKLEQDVAENFLNLGFVILEGYGLTETSPVISLTTPDKPRTGTPGSPIDGVQVVINSPDSKGTGEIIVKGPNVMRGYYKNPDETKKVLKDGWFYTGDLGTIDSKGNIRITGRSKEVIVLPSGKNIYPEEVEINFEKSALIKEVCAAPFVNESRTPMGLKLVVVPNKKELLGRNVFSIKDRIRDEVSVIGSRLPSYMHINHVDIVYSDLPRTRLGKLKRKEVEELVKKENEIKTEELVVFTDEEKTLLESEVSKRFLKRLEEVGNITGPFHPSQELSVDLGLDSLTLIELTVVLENEFGLKLTDEELSDINKLEDILSRIQNSDTNPPVSHDTNHLKSLLYSNQTEPVENIFNLNRRLFIKKVMRVFHLITFMCIKIMFRIKVEGTEKIPKDRPVLICPNHQSFIDPFIIYACLPGHLANKLMYVAFGEYFQKPPASWLIKPWRIVTTGSTRDLGKSLKLSYEGLKKGLSVCIFPEGGRTTTGDIMTPRHGAGILSVESNAPIVPILIDGALDTMSHMQPGFRFSKIRIFIGDPINPPPASADSKVLYQQVVDNWKDKVIDLQKGLL
jgi:long-chain acyl-CoA synthetase